MSNQPTSPPKPRPKSRAQILSEDPELCDGLFLVMNGIPFDVAFSLDEEERLAWVVIIGEFKGGRYDWYTNSWEPTRS